MASSNQFTARGQAVVGFQTNPTGGPISKGAEIAGDDFGLIASGPVGVRGEGSPGPGGEFRARAMHPQLRLVPHNTPGDAPTATPVAPKERKLPANRLPKAGKVGDILVTKHDATIEPILWVCTNDRPGHARWAQLLLGTPIEGTAQPIDE